MIKYLLGIATFFLSANLFAGCCVDSTDSWEVGLGWRRDNLKWKLQDLSTSYIDADASSFIHFKDIEFYTIHTKIHSVGCEYYFRASADYGTSEKGRAIERFGLETSMYDIDDLTVRTSDRIKKRSEVYDFSGAIGYPFKLCGCRLMIAPLIGFSFNRQHLRSKNDKSRYDSSSFYYDSSDSSDSSSSGDSSEFSVNSSNPFDFGSSDPFSSYSEETIASALGLSIDKRSSNYRFTWYGFYAGVDIAYALDTCWTIFSESEYHFLDRCHRKRKSITGVYFVDRYHHKGKAYGFNQTIGTTYDMGANYYFSLAVDFKWWKADSHKFDHLQWQSVGVNAALGYYY
jgi:hypothetical protein